jgi:hypothetical protein
LVLILQHWSPSSTICPHPPPLVHILYTGPYPLHRFLFSITGPYPTPMVLILLD